MRRTAVDLTYLLAAGATAPVWLPRMARTGKLRTDWPGRLGRTSPVTRNGRPHLLIHAVSVGEINAIRTLVQTLDRGPEPVQLTIASTTDTGVARAQALYGRRHRIVRYPFDLSPAVRRFLDAVRPDAVALVELEVWPNFTAICQQRGIPVCVINGRLTERSHRRYGRIRRLAAPAFRRLAFAAVQSDTYGRRFRSLMGPQASIAVTGTMKWDSAEIADDVPGAAELAEAMGIDRSRPLVVAGSTAPGEDALLHRAVGDRAQLLCAPRRPEWFDAAAAELPGCARRSRGDRGSPAGRFLLDTIGELRQAYAIADVVVVGRSFGGLHGSDMMEPIALGKPTLIGPRVDDFQEVFDALHAAGGIRQVTAEELPGAVAELLGDGATRRELAERGRAVIQQHQGASTRTVGLLRQLLARSSQPQRGSAANA